jgi:sarcosine oxidase subunit alpha
MAAAVELARRGRTIEVIENDHVWGRTARTLDDPTLPAAARWAPLLGAFEQALASGVVLHLGATAAGIYGDDLLCRTADGAIDVLTARTLVLAPGAHDGVLPFEGNDLPGIVSVRAACALLGYGVRLGASTRVVAAVCSETSEFADAYARLDPQATVVRGTPVRARGAKRIRAVTLSTPDGERELPCDALVVDAPRAPAYELCAQAGATLVPTPRGFVVQTRARGAIRASVFAVGEVVGAPLRPAAVLEQAAELAELDSRA